jgi:hypothetical protein
MATEAMTAEPSEAAKSLARTAVALRLAHDGILAEDLQGVLRLSRETARAYQRKMLEADAIPAEEAEGMIHIGDLVQNFAAPEPAPTAQASPAATGGGAAAPSVMTGGAAETARETVQKAVETASRASPWVKAALYAGLIAAGGGAGVGIPALFGAFSKAAPAAAAAVKSANQNVAGWELVTEPRP